MTTKSGTTGSSDMREHVDPGKVVKAAHRFSVPAERVFDAWLDPQCAGSWLFTTPSSRMAKVEIDARVGGRFRFVDHGDGEDVPHTGEYLEIDRPRRLVFTVRAERYSPHVYRVAIDIEPERTGCVLTLTQALHVDDDPAFAESLALGWTGNLERLERSLTESVFERSPAKARVTYRFDASAERVFDAWLDPEKVRRWFGPNLGEMVRVDVDPKIGGTFSFVQRRGEDDIDHIGVYLEIERPRRLVFTWGVAPDPPDSRVVIDIVALPWGCELTLTHEMPAEWAEFAQRSAAAWTKMTTAMAAALA